MRLTRYRYNNTPLDNNGHYYYIKENDTIWNPGWQPSQTELDTYECRHGLGYTCYKGTKNNLEACVTTFVPIGSSCVLTRLSLRTIQIPLSISACIHMLSSVYGMLLMILITSSVI